MKYSFFVLLATLCASAAMAQTEVQPKKNLQQKRYLDSLQKKYRETPATGIIVPAQPQLVYNTPVSPMNNEGTIVDMSDEDTVYKMKTDNMRVLKPNTKTTQIPNAAEGKIFMVPPPAKKP